MASNSTSDISRGPESSHRGMERETDSPPGQPAEAGSDRSKDNIGADMITPPNGKTLGTLIVSIGLALLGIFWMVAATRIPNKTGFGSLGPGFLPFWAGVILTVIAGGLIVGAIRARIGNRIVSDTGSRLPEIGLLRVVGTLAALLVYIVLLSRLHFFINTFLLAAVGLALSGEPLKPRLLMVAALISAALFAIFIYWLEIPLPGSRIFG
jgi:putative tricarboxylic transport membrane protein